MCSIAPPHTQCYLPRTPLHGYGHYIQQHSEAKAPPLYSSNGSPLYLSALAGHPSAHLKRKQQTVASCGFTAPGLYELHHIKRTASLLPRSREKALLSC